MENSLINEIVEKLKGNPVFNMSLSSKELFHSNILAWLLLCKEKEAQKDVINLFKPKDAKDNEYTVLTVFREKKNFDLLIIYIKKTDYTSFISERKKAEIKIEIEDAVDTIYVSQENWNMVESQIDYLRNCKYVVIENKFKSIPTEKQLDEYVEKIKNNETLFVYIPYKDKIKLTPENTSYYLFAPKKIRDFFKLPTKWKFIEYEDFLDKIDIDNANNFILDNYKNFTNEMLRLANSIKISSETKMFEYENTIHELRKIRIHDFYEKLWFSIVMNQINKKINKDNKINTLVGYSNGMGMLNFYFLESKDITCGIEIQCKQFRFFVFPAEDKKWKTKNTKIKEEKKKYPKIFDVLSSIKKAWIDKIDGMENENQKEKLNKFNDFKYVYQRLPETCTVEQLSCYLQTAEIVIKQHESEIKKLSIELKKK